MAKMSALAAEGVTDLHSYLSGRQDERDDLIRILNVERKYAEGYKDLAMVKITTNLIELLTVERYPADPETE